jgi:hypothetical protein
MLKLVVTPGNKPLKFLLNARTLARIKNTEAPASEFHTPAVLCAANHAQMRLPARQHPQIFPNARSVIVSILHLEEGINRLTTECTNLAGQLVGLFEDARFVAVECWFDELGYTKANGNFEFEGKRGN